MGGKLQNVNDYNLNGKSKQYRNEASFGLGNLQMWALRTYSQVSISYWPFGDRNAHDFLRSWFSSQGLSAQPESGLWGRWYTKADFLLRAEVGAVGSELV